jgi:hypothetical protein
VRTKKKMTWMTVKKRMMRKMNTNYRKEARVVKVEEEMKMREMTEKNWTEMTKKTM